MMKDLTRNNKEGSKEDIDVFIQDLDIPEDAKRAIKYKTKKQYL